MSDLSISQLVPAMTSAELAAADLEVVVDVSTLTMAPTGSDRAMTAQEKAWAYVRLSKAYRGLITPSTAYNPGDYVQFLDGRVVEIILPCTSSVTATIGSANYVLVVPQFYIIASSGMLYDSNPVSAATNTTALQAYLNMANPTGANAVGGKVLLSKGGFYTNTFMQIPNGVTLEGNSTFGTYWSLADASNCSVVGPHVSTGAGNANAFYWGLRDVSIDCRQAQQGAVITNAGMTVTSTTITAGSRNWVNGEHVVGSGILPGTTIVSGGGTTTGVMSAPAEQTLANATVYCGISSEIYGVHCNINPLTSQQSGDWGFDPSGLIFNVVVKNSRDGAFANFGRSANVYFRCKTSASLGIGFIGSFDTRYNSCESDFSAWHGFDLRGSSQQVTNCKSYNSGQVKTTAAATSNFAHGYKVNFYTYIAITGCDSQQNTGNAYHLENGATGIAISGCTAASYGFTSGTTTAVGFHLDNAQGCTISATAAGISGTSALRLIGGSDHNNVTITQGPPTPGTPLAAGSALLNNFVIIHGTALNAPGLVSTATLDSAFPKRYSISTSGGSNHNIGMLTTQGTAALNTMQLVPYWPDRAGTITQITTRVGTGNVATAVLRGGVYSSNKTGGNVFTLEAELPTLADCSATGTINVIAFSSPITIDLAKMYWVASVPQVALAAFQTSMGDHLAGSTVNPTGGYCFTWNGVSGALPATLTFSTVSAPVHLSAGISVGLTVTG